ncbi:MFS transporter [Paenibacillus assamensis]|uniref:MFS transporter n=1 Tax=Paenibacillus assamensis TaxID=311244 RepID=UPI0003FC44FB|nr:MFS transporter [Paenibacillus assamensis]
MATFFLLIIYLAFISLGLPDSLLGVAWPIMHKEYNASFETAGLLSMIIAGGTIVSSSMSGLMLKWLGTGRITFISSLMTAAALLGFAYAPSLIWLIVLAIPLGLGAGAVDAALNNYVALHYKAHHMSWLHSFWGVGATIGPFIMSYYMVGSSGWRDGYFTIAMIQFALVVILLLTLPLWKRVVHKGNDESATDTTANHNEIDATISTHDTQNKKGSPLKMKGAKATLLAFLFYCGTEATMGLWGSSFLVNVKGLPASVAAQWVSMYYAGITVGRFITGFITLKVSNKMLIRSGQFIALTGAVILLLPLPTTFSLIGFIMVGLGCAPIYPCMLHETPVRFGKEQSQHLMGYQMAVAYTGATLLPPLLGWAASLTTIAILPYVVVFFILAMLFGSERGNAVLKSIKYQVK